MKEEEDQELKDDVNTDNETDDEGEIIHGIASDEEEGKVMDDEKMG